MRGALEGAEHVLVVVRLHDLDLGPAAVAPTTADVGTQADLAPLLTDRSASRASRSALPGAYMRLGSLTGCGGWVTASMSAMLSDKPIPLNSC